MSTPWTLKAEDLPHLAATRATPLAHVAFDLDFGISKTGRGEVTLDLNDPAAAAILTGAQGSLIVAYQGDQRRGAFYARRKYEPTTENQRVRFTGPGIADVLYRTEVEPFSTGMPEWYWGADSILGNGGFEESLEETDGEGEDAVGTGVFVPTYWELSPWGPMASNGFQVTTAPDPVRTGTYSLKMNPLGQFAGVQQRLRVLPGGLYQAELYNIKPTAPNDTYTLVVRDIEGNLIGTRDDQTSQATWYPHNLTDLTIPDGVDEIIYRFAYIGTGNPSPNYLDDARLYPGQPAATVGAILDALIARAVTRGALTWLDTSSWSTTLDSNGNAWDASISFTATHGRSIGQVLDQLARLGYEWAVGWNGTAWALDVFNPGEMGNSTPTAAVIMGRDIGGGDLTRNEPTATAVRAEGADGLTVTVEDAGAIATWGRREKFVRDTSINDATTLTKFANAELTSRLTLEASRFEVIGGQDSEPFIDYQLGDTIETVTRAGQAQRRIHAITVKGRDRDAYELDLDGVVLTAEAAQAEGMRRLLTRFEELATDRADVGGPSGSASGLVPVSGAMPVIVVAASNAPPTIQARADFVASGVNDEFTIQAAIDWWAEQQAFGAVLLSGGTFYCGAANGGSALVGRALHLDPDLTPAAGGGCLAVMGTGIAHEANDYVPDDGHGLDAPTHIQIDTTGATPSGALAPVSALNGRLERLSITATGTAYTGVVELSTNAHLRDCAIWTNTIDVGVIAFILNPECLIERVSVQAALDTFRINNLQGATFRKIQARGGSRAVFNFALTNGGNRSGPIFYGTFDDIHVLAGGEDPGAAVFRVTVNNTQGFNRNFINNVRVEASPGDYDGGILHVISPTTAFLKDNWLGAVMVPDRTALPLLNGADAQRAVRREDVIDVPTASLPPAADVPNALRWDSTTNQLKFSDGTSWFTVGP